MSRNAPLITWDNLIDNAKTGDLILCDGQSLLSQAIEWLTWGDFSHIGMVVTDPDGGVPWIWQANDTKVADDPRHAHGPHCPNRIDPTAAGGGAQLGFLDQALNTIDHAADVVYYRSIITKDDPTFDQAVRRVVEIETGTRFPTYSSITSEMEVNYAIKGLIENENSGDGSFFCSQLVAFTYQRAAMLDTRWVPNSYSPSDFATPSVEGFDAQLGPIFRVDMSTVPGHGESPGCD